MSSKVRIRPLITRDDHGSELSFKVATLEAGGHTALMVQFEFKYSAVLVSANGWKADTSLEALRRLLLAKAVL